MGKPYPKEKQTRKPERGEDDEPKLGVTADDVSRALLAHFRKAARRRGDVFPLVEVGLDRGRRVDLLLVSYYRDPVAFEIKVSRSDWLSELRQGAKHVPAQDFAGQLYFAAPPGVIEEHELPDGTGLYVVQAYTGKVSLKVRANRNTPASVVWKDVAKCVSGALRAAERGIT